MNRQMFFEAMRPVYFVCVDTAGNKNKFYRIIPNPDGKSFRVQYGRVGAPNAKDDKKTYPAEMFDQMYKKRIDHGYKDQTDLVKTALDQSGDGYKAISDPDVSTLVNALRAYADKTVAQNYNVSTDAITQKMLDEARQILDQLHQLGQQIKQITNNDYSSAYKFNQMLNNLFITIPRKMKKTQDFIIPRDYIVNSDKRNIDISIDKILTTEENLYNVLLTNFQTQQAVKSNQSNASSGNLKTILEEFGLECEVITDQAKIDELKNNLGEVKSRFKKAYKVKNLATQTKFEQWCKSNSIPNPILLYHGSRNENFWSILKNGLQLNPKAVVNGKMLGNGIYFAPLAKKSLGYTSASGSYWVRGSSSSGFIAIFSVGIDQSRILQVRTSSQISQCYGMNYDKLQKIQPGATGVYAYGRDSSPGSSLYNDEVVVYKEEQATIRYLIEVS